MHEQDTIIRMRAIKMSLQILAKRHKATDRWERAAALYGVKALNPNRLSVLACTLTGEPFAARLLKL